MLGPLSRSACRTASLLFSQSLRWLLRHAVWRRFTPDESEERLAPVFTGSLALGLMAIALASPHQGGAVDQSVPILKPARFRGAFLSPKPLLFSGCRRASLRASGHAHDEPAGGHGAGFVEPPPPELLDAEDQAIFDRQWQSAVESATDLMTVEQATAAGYRQASTEAPGVGEHWVKWSLVDQSFDPAQPSMLLFSERRPGRPPVLVGFSYWVGSAEVPEGFAGPNDMWHTHHGMCFVDGWLKHEQLDRRENCEDTWVEGSDLWMLHAWPVPGAPNRWGFFADMNPALCRTPRNTPDILRCDPSRL